LALDPKYTSILKKMRKNTSKIEKQMTPVSSVFEPETATSVEVLEWVKTAKPELYQQMQNGVEIGFKKLTNEYKATHKKTTNNKKNKSDE
jgi:N-sulfoglucosamine sulfohydrolase